MKLMAISKFNLDYRQSENSASQQVVYIGNNRDELIEKIGKMNANQFRIFKITRANEIKWRNKDKSALKGVE